MNIETELNEHGVYGDLRMSGGICGPYRYVRDSQGNTIVKHYGDDGKLLGTQSIHITVGDFKPVTA